MAYIYKNGKATTVQTSDVKIPKRIVTKVDLNRDSKEIIDMAIKSVKKAKVKYTF
ncbi:MAG: hypothetical protein RBR33_08855 [Sulfurovaceae bacterium]|nr:hypothetical protein [Sulfurovaceae bacterium]